MRKHFPTAPNTGKICLHPLLSEILHNDAHHNRHSKMGLPKSNLDGLKSAITYFTKLRDSGQLTNEVFQALIAKSCAVYVDKEVQRRVEGMIARKLSPENIIKRLS